MTGMNDFAQCMCIGSELTKASAEGINEQNHQGTPEAVMQRAGHTIGKTGGCRRIEGRCPDLGCGHAGSAHTKADALVRHHEAIGVIGTGFDAAGQQVSTAVERNQQ